MRIYLPTFLLGLLLSPPFQIETAFVTQRIIHAIQPRSINARKEGDWTYESSEYEGLKIGSN